MASSSSSSSAAASSSSLNPTTRSRTLLFISYRDSRAGSPRSRRSRVITNYDNAQDEDDEHERLINADSGHIAIDAELPPKWVDIADQVKEILAGVEAKMAVLDKLHAKHVLPGFSDRSAEEREIEAATTEITKDFRQCHALIQRIGSMPQHSFPPAQPGQSRHHELAAKNVQRGLAARVQELSATFRKKQRVYMEKMQGHAIKNQDLLAASGAVSLRGSAGMSALDEDMEAAASSTDGVIVRQLAMVPDELQARDRELAEIARSIASLAELFKDLQSLVIDQGTLLDSVEYNIEQTATQMEDAVRELDTATKYQKNTGRRQCIFLLLLLIFGLILVLIFKPRRHRASAAPSSSDASSTAAVPVASSVAAIADATSTALGGDVGATRDGREVREAIEGVLWRYHGRRGVYR
ncbi:t-SNARE [Trametes coccinea BRFM310]|uniref:t-SNARE n=1 Tax=Trametes coccinea (strain BRFM310) TaxID=1353009 RepID=A0A1Y2IJ94_TRAC3|nr:t-SNARE [Trametes coccinea BRFM310]